MRPLAPNDVDALSHATETTVVVEPSDKRGLSLDYGALYGPIRLWAQHTPATLIPSASTNLDGPLPALEWQAARPRLEVVGAGRAPFGDVLFWAHGYYVGALHGTPPVLPRVALPTPRKSSIDHGRAAPCDDLLAGKNLPLPFHLGATRRFVPCVSLYNAGPRFEHDRDAGTLLLSAGPHGAPVCEIGGRPDTAGGLSELRWRNARQTLIYEYGAPQYPLWAVPVPYVVRQFKLG